VDQFNDGDRERIREMIGRIELLERGQRVSLRRIRRLPDLTATAMVRAVSKRALVLIGLGIAIGSVLGGAGFEAARKLISSALGSP